MVTFFTTAKPFKGHDGVIQRNALKSWMLAVPDGEVILFGDEEGAADTAVELGIRHVAEVERAVFGEAGAGPKLLRSFFDPAQKLARHDTVCYINCDIILTGDFRSAVSRVKELGRDFLMVGRRWDTDVREPIRFEQASWADKLRQLAREKSQQLKGDWIDYFVFPRGFYLGRIPELVIGRVYWDQWLVWKARSEGAALVDASGAVMAIHQNHDYRYHPAGKSGVWSDDFSRKNYELSGGRWHLCTIEDATHLLGPEGLQRNPAQRQRALRRMLRGINDSVWASALDWTRPVRRAIGWQRRRP
jgi:hypothetical protein